MATISEVVPPPEPPPSSDRRPLQEQILADIGEQTPALLAAFFFDLGSEEINAELVAAPDETADRLIIDKLPAFVKCIPETEEGIAMITDRSQPVTLASALLLNSAHRYLAMLAGTAV